MRLHKFLNHVAKHVADVHFRILLAQDHPQFGGGELQGEWRRNGLYVRDTSLDEVNHGIQGEDDDATEMTAEEWGEQDRYTTEIPPELQLSIRPKADKVWLDDAISVLCSGNELEVTVVGKRDGAEVTERFELRIY